MLRKSGTVNDSMMFQGFSGQLSHPLLGKFSPDRITSDVSHTRLRRGATGTPALWRRAIARQEVPCAVGIESRSCSEFGAEDQTLEPTFSGTVISGTAAGRLLGTGPAIAEGEDRAAPCCQDRAARHRAGGSRRGGSLRNRSG